MAEEKLVQTWEEFGRLADKTGHSSTMELAVEVTKQLAEKYPGLDLFSTPMPEVVAKELTPLVRRVMGE